MIEASRPGEFSSRDYWEVRYRNGGTSGAGSMGRLARFKADVINSFVAGNDIRSVMDFGCGDGSQLSLLTLSVHGRPTYVGVDVSPAALARCAQRFPAHRFVAMEDVDTLPPAELAMSIDVIYHLVEDDVFARTIDAVFSHATRFVLIYASNLDLAWPSRHVRHRRFTDHVAASRPDWRLLAHVPNRYPFDRARPDDTSFADFFVYGKQGTAFTVRVGPEN